MNEYVSKSPQTWLQATRDYIAGCASEFDPLLNLVEAQIEPLASHALLSPHARVPMVDAAGSFTEVSRQFWAMLNPLLSQDADKATMFANVERHHGPEVWRTMAELVVEDKALVRRDLFSTVTNPKGASSMDKVETAVEE